MHNVHGEYHHLLLELFEDPRKLVDYLRMQPTSLNGLPVSVRLVKDKSSRLDSNNQLFVFLFLLSFFFLFIYFQREVITILKHGENYVP